MSERTTTDDIRRWLQRGREQGATHLIVVCDQFDYGDFPVYVMPGENATAKTIHESKQAMQRVMEVYKLSLPWEAQISEYRAWHLD